ncbi:MAG: hypothetical protein E6Q95_05650 [Chitinophagaceae bacterium]|nr:MAG: hypothetical protein E6Q95_05650 [Chitinophagaceae bacterium]
MNRYKIYFLIIIFVIGSKIGIAQTTGSKNVSISLNEVMIMDIEPVISKNLVMNFTVPTQAGNPIAIPANNTALWLNYTSALASGSRHITARISATIPGVDIKLTAGAATGIGAGTRGVSTGQKILTTTNQTIISGIGGAFTGNGSSNGHQLIYTLGINNYTQLIKTNTSITVTYTISN